MSGHDPMCQTRTDHYPSWCDCPRVHAIRADQVDTIRAAVSALDSDPGWAHGSRLVSRAAVLALLGPGDATGG